MSAINITDKVVLITGAYGLIGKAISKIFLEEGAKVVLADIDTSKKESVYNEVLSLSSEHDFLIHDLDITNTSSCQNCISQAIAKFGKIDVLINNAAIDAKFDKQNISQLNQSSFENYPVDRVKKSINVNITGTIQITQAVCRQMLNQGFGNIINVASVYSVIAPNSALYDFGETQMYKPIDYVITKSFIPNFTRYIGAYYAKKNIRCNAIVPHGVFNNHDEKFVSNFSKLSPLGRMCDTNELAGPFIFLASDASSYMTGSVLVVDGGWTIW